jgi:hypothetical protein
MNTRTDPIAVPPFVLVGTGDKITASQLRVHVRYVQPDPKKVGVLLRGKVKGDVELTFWSRRGDQVQSDNPPAVVVEAIKRDFQESVFFGNRQFGVVFIN